MLVDGYLTQAKLVRIVQTVTDGWVKPELVVPGTRRRWDVGFSHPSWSVAEFDGDGHYRDPLVIRSDTEKDVSAGRLGLRTVRVPYWVQLDTETFGHFFGFDADVTSNFPHGFIATKLFPASFCELGLRRFERELADLPDRARRDVLASLRDRCSEYGTQYVVPSGFRL